MCFGQITVKKNYFFSSAFPDVLCFLMKKLANRFSYITWIVLFSSNRSLCAFTVWMFPLRHDKRTKKFELCDPLNFDWNKIGFYIKNEWIICYFAVRTLLNFFIKFFFERLMFYGWNLIFHLCITYIKISFFGNIFPIWGNLQMFRF